MSDTYHAPEPYRAWAKGDEHHGGPWHVYILHTDAGHYIGHTGNLERRLSEHERGQHKATLGLRPTLVWATEQPRREEATLLEATLKSLRDQRADTFEAMTGIKPIPLASHEELIDRLRSAWKEQHDIVQRQNNTIGILEERNKELIEALKTNLEYSRTIRIMNAISERLDEGLAQDFPFSDKFRDKINKDIYHAYVGDILGALLEKLHTVSRPIFPHFKAPEELLNKIVAAIIDRNNVGYTIGILIIWIMVTEDINESNGMINPRTRNNTPDSKWNNLDWSEQDEALIEFWKGNRSAEDYA